MVGRSFELATPSSHSQRNHIQTAHATEQRTHLSFPNETVGESSGSVNNLRRHRDSSPLGGMTHFSDSDLDSILCTNTDVPSSDNLLMLNSDPVDNSPTRPGNTQTPAQTMHRLGATVSQLDPHQPSTPAPSSDDPFHFLEEPWKVSQGIEIIPGRALLLLLPWHNNQTLNILSIYAPNPHTENEAFWTNLHQKWTQDGLPFVHVLLGDFNLVEDGIDCLPAHDNPIGPREALSKFKALFTLLDGWCHENPGTIAHTWHQCRWDLHLGLDRIYINSENFKHSCNWSISPTPIDTDHDLVNVRIFNTAMPYVGRGQWTIPLFTLQDKKIMDVICDKGMTCLKEIELLSKTNPAAIQHKYKTFKDDLINTFCNYAKKHIPMVDNKIDHKISQLKDVLQSDQNETEKAILASELKEDIRSLERKRHLKSQQLTSVKFTLKDETLDPDWLRRGKEPKPRAQTKSPNQETQ
ncbi:hypothetical protein M422DRAFT_252146 [Sphaerobolus stellatus SS14]|uniref:Endonuclease/exonuclease/phosphatase domain-containing protein n=1 Tax=Sphaerobolus stellatus (strain SS14) TaxID=990650 RepID=A0A0C9W0V0_SPHS4|nr:hypothetical protein M422DRAFT_252146 [Sphaerobolus stellatus SS14]